MTPDYALTANVRLLSPGEMDEARRVLGAVKLALRQRHPLDRVLDRLRPYNARIDEINVEDVERQRRGR